MNLDEVSVQVCKCEGQGMIEVGGSLYIVWGQSWLRVVYNGRLIFLTGFDIWLLLLEIIL